MMTIALIDKPELKIISDIDLNYLGVQIPLKGFYSKDEIKAMKKKPYILKKRALFNIFYENEQYCFLFDKGYTWDGATIPFGTRWIIGTRGCSAFLLASMVHDKLCEKHKLIKNNRYLSSLIFKELLLVSGVNKFKAEIMFKAVDLFQKYFIRWKEDIK